MNEKNTKTCFDFLAAARRRQKRLLLQKEEIKIFFLVGAI